MKKVLLTCAAASLLVGSTVASAAAIAPPPMFHPWYVGVGLKWNANTHDKRTIEPVSRQLNDIKTKNKLGWDIFAGYLVSPKFGTELGFVDYGKVTRTWTLAGVNQNKWDADGWLVYFDGMYYIPLGQYFKIFAKGGVDYINHGEKSYQWSAASSSWVRTAGTAVDRKLNVVSGNLGAGIQIDYNQFGARFTYTNYNEFIHENTNAVLWVPNLLNLDILYHFG